MIRVGSKVRYWSKTHSTYFLTTVTQEFSDGTLGLSLKEDAHIPRDQVVLQSNDGLDESPTLKKDESAFAGNEDACGGAGGARRPSLAAVASRTVLARRLFMQSWACSRVGLSIRHHLHEAMMRTWWQMICVVL